MAWLMKMSFAKVSEMFLLTCLWSIRWHQTWLCAPKFGRFLDCCCQTSDSFSNAILGAIHKP